MDWVVPTTPNSLRYLLGYEGAAFERFCCEESYFADLTRTYVVSGKPNEEQLQVYETVKKSAVSGGRNNSA